MIHKLKILVLQKIILQLEEEAAQFESENGHFPSVKEWAVLAEMPLARFRRRLMLALLSRK